MSETEKETPSLPPHLFPLPGGQWALWRWIGLRGAGFAASQVLELASPSCGLAADRMLQAEEEYGAAQAAAVGAVEAAIEARWRDNLRTDSEKRDPLAKTMRALKKGKAPDPPGLPYPGDETLEAFREAAARYHSLRASFQQAFAAAVNEISPRIFEQARSAKFREAIIWQNRHAYHTSIETALRKPAGSRSYGVRHAEELIASYLQRYCVKNDTIGFFGPVGWAEFAAEAEAVSIRPGPAMLAERNLYLEVWCVEELAKTLSQDKSLRPWIAPTRQPYVHARGDELHISFRGSFKLTPEQAAVFFACDGEKLAREIASELVQRPGTRLRAEEDVYRQLEVLHNRGVISWALEAPMEMHPERVLRERLGRVGDEGLRAGALGALRELEEWREAVGRAGGDPEALDEALGGMEEAFTRLTGATPTRGAGRTYAARTLIYEDCRRDLEVKIGSDVLKSLGPPLSLLLTSARWFTHQTASAYRQSFSQLHAELSRRTGSAAVDFLSFWSVAQARLFVGQQRPVDALALEFQKRWSEILDVPWHERRVAYRVEELRARVEAAFDAPRPGWSFARYHSPDLMIAAESAEALCRGDYQLVLGEMHIGANTLGWPVFLSQHPSPGDLLAAVDLDLPEPRLVPIIAKSQQLQSARLLPALISEKDYRLRLASEPTGVPPSRIIPVGELVVADTGRGLVAQTRDGSRRFDIIEAVSDALMALVMSRFKILTPHRHTPRISFDRLVISRESWSFDASELAFVFEKDEAERFAAARRWARSHGIPRFAFVKSSAEVKPFYVDFDSPVYVNFFARTARPDTEGGAAEARITVSEMFPRHDQAWLPDAEGRRYTSELRIVAFDRGDGADG